MNNLYDSELRLIKELLKMQLKKEIEEERGPAIDTYVRIIEKINVAIMEKENNG